MFLAKLKIFFDWLKGVEPEPESEPIKSLTPYWVIKFWYSVESKLKYSKLTVNTEKTLEEVKDIIKRSGYSGMVIFEFPTGNFSEVHVDMGFVTNIEIERCVS